MIFLQTYVTDDTIDETDTKIVSSDQPLHLSSLKVVDAVLWNKFCWTPTWGREGLRGTIFEGLSQFLAIFW